MNNPFDLLQYLENSPHFQTAGKNTFKYIGDAYKTGKGEVYLYVRDDKTMKIFAGIEKQFNLCGDMFQPGSVAELSTLLNLLII